MYIRIATSVDRENIGKVHLCAFPQEEKEIVAKLAIDLLSEETTPQTISLVAETGGTVVGHIAFSPVTIHNQGNLQGYILTPLGVKPDYQNRGIGSKLINSGIQQLSNMGVNIVFVYGNPKYYGKFGFSVDTAAPYVSPYKLKYPYGWQATILNEFEVIESAIKMSFVNSLCNPELW